MQSGTPITVGAHWEEVYARRPEAELSWRQGEPERSLALIQGLGLPPQARIVDVGAGASPLAQRLLDLGYRNLTVLDVSHAALSLLRSRLGARASQVHFVVGDLLRLDSIGEFDLWHDRAVFHFLTEAADRARYAELAAKSVAAGGSLIVATFAPDGPESCSGLPVRRYDAEGIAQALGPAFTLLQFEREIHVTPAGASQPFTYAVLRKTT